MSSEPAIRVERLSKKFARSLKKAMAYGLVDIARVAFLPRRARSPQFAARVADAASAPAPAADVAEGLRPSEFWAVRDVSFEVRSGECLGLIGANGAGKSTIFKIMSGIYGPTSGRVEIRGRLSALIEVGAGFHPMLSGRENIYISGAVLGMTTAQIEKKYEQIVDFSGVRDFIDMPVKFYSSGMHVRLGFAVLAYLEPEVLLIDEILAVGDMEFQKKCIDRINEMRQSRMAIALVSHSLYRIESLCHRAVWLDHGKVVLSGPARDVVRAYRDRQILLSADEARAKQGGGAAAVAESPFFTVHRADPLHEDGRADARFAFGETLAIRLAFTAKQRIERPLFNLAFVAAGVRVLETSMLVDGQAPECVEGPGELVVRLPAPRLLPNAYTVELFIRNREGMVDLIDTQTVTHFTITSDGLEAIPQAGPYALGHLMHGNIVHQPYEWDLSRIRQPEEAR
ncbi:MAG TPA: ABC transporter ATP-binding protein [Kiritimatiellia bacterium]|nr:ABC transporter ATP-binding protein [Kiritimatiellia bacterium]HRZ11468.1 ABC transporter ATP-binding protein [Kiritimatiellia bacterium]HSA16981.1 ABC transporter ATP-binding protein [Kiritimatiellia bacterium]